MEKLNALKVSMALLIASASLNSAAPETVESLRPYLVRMGKGDRAGHDGLFIRADGVPTAVFMWERYPILAGQAAATRRALDVSTNIIRVQTVIFTNTVIKWQIKEDVARLKEKRRNIGLGTGGAILAAILGGLIGWGIGRK